MAKARFAFLNGEIVPWDQATVHVASGAFKYGAAVFEGIRGYWNEAQGEMYLFQVDEHMRRLTRSQTFMRFAPLADTRRIGEQVAALVRANEFREPIHIMPTVYVQGSGDPGVTGPVDVSITATARPSPAWVREGCRVQVSSWQRIADQAMPVRVKCNANYQNSRLATLQARVDGYDTALLLNSRGKVAEGPGMCFFMFRDGKAITPPVTSDILESITRRTVMGLLSEYCDTEVVERDVDRSEIVYADEAFFCGTAWEVTPITSVDRLPIGAGEVGPLVRRLQDVFFGIATGTRTDHPEWRTPVYGA